MFIFAYLCLFFFPLQLFFAFNPVLTQILDKSNSFQYDVKIQLDSNHAHIMGPLPCHNLLLL